MLVFLGFDLPDDLVHVCMIPTELLALFKTPVVLNILDGPRLDETLFQFAELNKWISSV